MAVQIFQKDGTNPTVILHIYRIFLLAIIRYVLYNEGVLADWEPEPCVVRSDEPIV